jgi:hypothetical protein
MGHHKDRVDRKLGYSLQAKPINEHKRSLHPRRGVAQHSTGADRHIETHEVNELITLRGLFENVGDPLLSRTFEADREGAVMIERESQCLSANRLLKPEIVNGLWNRGWTDHLVAQAIA